MLVSKGYRSSRCHDAPKIEVMHGCLHTRSTRSYRWYDFLPSWCFISRNHCGSDYIFPHRDYMNCSCLDANPAKNIVAHDPRGHVCLFDYIIELILQIDSHPRNCLETNFCCGACCNAYFLQVYDSLLMGCGSHQSMMRILLAPLLPLDCS